MNQEIQKSLDELNDIMTNVSSCYAVWRELTDVVNREKYEDIKDKYEYFFMTIDYANFAMVINGLNMLFEEKQNTHNLKSVFLMQRPKGKCYESKIDQWPIILDGWSEMVRKIKILRSNIFSHRGKKGTAETFMEKAAITPDEIGKLVEKSESLLKEFTEAASIEMQLNASYAGEVTKVSTQEIMTALKAEDA